MGGKGKKKNAHSMPCAGSNVCTLSWQELVKTFGLDSVQFTMSLNGYCPQGRDTL